jgi:hypothetical protein
MTKKLLLVSAVMLAPLSSAFAVDNIGGCGWGSKLFSGQKGIVPQVLAVTTNGTSGNQTFGITTGTSGCTQDGVVKSNWKTAMFIGNNMNKLARDMSVGNGEALDSLASLMNVSEQDRAEFNSTLQAQFSSVFSSEEIQSEEVAANLRQVLSSSATLSAYAANV